MRATLTGGADGSHGEEARRLLIIFGVGDGNKAPLEVGERREATTAGLVVGLLAGK